MNLFINIGVGTVLMIATILLHGFGLYSITKIRFAISNRFENRATKYGGGLLVVGIILGVMLFHTLEIWIWASVYYFANIINGFENALYFSTVSFTTLGYGDIIAKYEWRLLTAFEAANGLLLFGWSTAYIFTALAHITGRK